jgi:hypothetical protein
MRAESDRYTVIQSAILMFSRPSITAMSQEAALANLGPEGELDPCPWGQPSPIPVVQSTDLVCAMSDEVVITIQVVEPTAPPHLLYNARI